MSSLWGAQQGAKRYLSIIVTMLALSGCSSNEFEDLRAYINEVKATSKGRIEPLPEFVPVESFSYSVDDYGDPFVSWEAKAAMAARADQQSSQGGGLQPDLGRRREPLESFPLDTLRMVGTMERDGQSSALVHSPDGLVSRIVEGNYLGQNYGQVVTVSPDKIDLIEIVPDGLGSWVRRPASLAIVE